MVYRVVEYDPIYGEMTWFVAERKVVQVRRDQKVVLYTPFPGSAGRIVEASSVFQSELLAVRAFRDQKIDAHLRATSELKKSLIAIDWTFNELGIRKL